jgi:hypothetical protein
METKHCDSIEYCNEIKHLLGKLHNYTDKYMDDLVFFKLNAKLKQNKYSSPRSKKAQIFLTNNVFKLILKDDLLMYTCSVINGEMTISYQLFTNIKTSKGIVYVCRTEHTYTCWKSHLFDNYVRRVDNKISNRLEAIEAFMTIKFKRGLLDIKRVGDLITSLIPGIGMIFGQYYDDQIIMYKTIIDESLYRKDQTNLTVKKLTEIEYKLKNRIPVDIEDFLLAKYENVI